MTRSSLLLASTATLCALALGGCGARMSPDELEPDIDANGQIVEEYQETAGASGGEGEVVSLPAVGDATAASTEKAPAELRDRSARAEPAKERKDKAADYGSTADRDAEGDASFAEEAAPADDAVALGVLSQPTASPVGAGGLMGPSTTRREASSARPSPALAKKSEAPGRSVAVAAAPPPPHPSGGAVLPDPQSSAEQYTDYGVNGFTLSQLDRLSTFSIDVDTASYAISRRKLQEGALPPQAAVRAEEFVNALDYDYAQPKSDSFAVTMDAMPDPFRAGHHILRVGVQGKELSEAERPRVHLTFLADVSGSMGSPDKLPMAQEALHLLVDRLQEGDTVAICTYAGRTAVVLPATDVSNKRAIHAAIDSLQSGGSTAMSSGIDLAYEQAWGRFEAGAENRVVVLSDGDANVGRSSWEELLGQIKGYADRGVTLTTVGFGQGNYKDTLMEQLANKGDGNSFYIDSKEEAQKVFVQDVGGAMITIARDVKIQVAFNPESVVAYRLIGYENRDIADKDFRNDRVDAGEVGSGHSVTALYDVILKDGYSKELAAVHLRWEAPGADKAAVERKWGFQSSRLAETPALAARDLRVAYGAGTLAEILRGSPHAAEIDLAALAAFTGAAARPGNKGDAELVGLIRTADRLGGDQVKGAVSVR